MNTSTAPNGAVQSKGLHPGLVVGVVDETGRPVRPGQHGEIVCRGAVVMRGYHRTPRLSRRQTKIERRTLRS